MYIAIYIHEKCWIFFFYFNQNLDVRANLEVEFLKKIKMY